MNAPLLAVGHGHRSIALTRLIEAALPLCRLAFLVDGSDPEVVATRRMLDRFGLTVDVAGLDAADAAAALAVHAPDGIAAFRDDDLIPSAAIAAQLGLRFLRPEVAEALSDKLLQRAVLAAAGLPVPGSWGLPQDPEELADVGVPTEIRFPAVVKPRRGSGSFYVSRVDGADELVALLGRLHADPAARQPLMIEEYLPDDPSRRDGGFAEYLSVETVVHDGRVDHVVVTGRLVPAPPFRETGMFVPSQLPDDALAPVLELADAAVSALGVDIGCLHIEIKLTPDGPRLIEVNGRLGGWIPDLVLLAGAPVDLLQVAVRVALGQPVELQAPLACQRVGYRLFHQPPFDARRVVTLDGVDTLRFLPGVESVLVNHPAGDDVDAQTGTRSHVFAVVGAADDHEHFRRIVDQVDRGVRLDYEWQRATPGAGRPPAQARASA